MYHGSVQTNLDTKYGINHTNSVVDPKDDHDAEYKILDLDLANAASTCDCTGLQYYPPQNDDEAEAYQEVYSFGPPSCQ